MNIRTKDGALIGTATPPHGSERAGFFDVLMPDVGQTLRYYLDRFGDKETGKTETAILAHHKNDAENIPGFKPVH